MSSIFPSTCVLLAAFHAWYMINMDGKPQFYGGAVLVMASVFVVPLLGTAWIAYRAKASRSKFMPWYSLSGTIAATFAAYPIHDFAGALFYLGSLVMSWILFARACTIWKQPELPYSASPRADELASRSQSENAS